MQTNPGTPDAGTPDAPNLPKQLTISVGDVRMVIDAAKGARIIEFSLGGTNVLSGASVNSSNYGSTFWPSPQSLWNWPPIAAIDTGAYAGSQDPSTGIVQLTSTPGALGTTSGAAQIQVRKTFTPVASSNGVDVTYQLANVSPAGGKSIQVAPWQITRVRGTGGLTFFAKGPGPVQAAAQLPLLEQSGMLWFAFAPATGDAKSFADAQGWVAHITQSRLALVLRYPDIAAGDSPSGEAEMELYTGSPTTAGDYLEIEPQGSQRTLAPGQSLEWTVRFLLRSLPTNVTAAVGNADLVSFVETVL